MGDVDFQMAMLLQRQFEQEQKPPNPPQDDLFLAMKLQNQFEQELAVENPKNNLVYEDKKRRQTNNASSLVDPSWEVIDPTPDVHVLFLAFNDRFFWGKLLAVCVDWSKRMTTCAGVCSYSGRGGMCKITLSEPLLKLRPRKDLVETLLHEMIHAFLFVTNNYRDRDSHGPEFLKHMYRINKESGTNITVYHDFHDEVRLYQQHWWRCDGPCQLRKPFFGMVRRAYNRAPGPNDFWWGEHSRSCGGTFVKVREPEKAVKQKTRKENIPTPPKKTKNDIRNYIPVLGVQNRNAGSKTIVVSSTSTSSQASTTSASSLPNSNIHGFSSTFYNNQPKNSTNTSSTTKNEAAVKNANVLKPGASVGIVGGKKPSAGDYSAVRSHWLSKFENGTLNNKRTSPNITISDSKKPKLSSDSKVNVINKPETDHGDFVSCPVCQRRLPSKEINAHLDMCLQEQVKDVERNGKGLDSDKEDGDFESGDSTFDLELVMVRCDVCGEQVDEKKIDVHLTSCLQSMVAGSDSAVEEKAEEEMVCCPVCDTRIPKSTIEKHLEFCLHKMYDNITTKYDIPKNDTFANRKSESPNLDNCRPSTAKCADLVSIDDENTNNQSESVQHMFQITNDDEVSAENTYNCPFCSGKYLENEMNAHLDYCLIIDDDKIVNNDF